MTRLKITFITALSLLALGSAAGAQIASASSFRAGEYPAQFQGYLTKGPSIGAGLGSLECQITNSWKIQGDAEASRKALESASVKETPCTNGEGKTTYLKMNGCHFIYHGGEQATPGKFNGTLEVGPAGCGAIEYNALGTLITIPAQEPVSGVTIENSGSGNGAAIEIASNVTTLKYYAGGKGPYNASYSDKWTVEATSAASGLPVGAFITDKPIGLDINSGSGLFESEEYPAVILGSQQVGQHLVLATNYWESSVSCGSALFEGTLAKAAASVNLGAQFGECALNIFGLKLNATTSMNSCYFVSAAQGNMAVGCGNPGDAITIKAVGCTIVIGPQEAGGGVVFTRNGSGSSRTLTMSVNLTGIQDTHSGGVCGSGSSNADTLKGSVLLGAEL